MPASFDDELPVYAVRLAAEAWRELDEEHKRLTALSSLQAANEWRTGLLDAIRTLAALPERCVVAPEDEIFKDVRLSITVSPQTRPDLAHPV